MPLKTIFDVIVVGGGPAGMMAAGRAAERGLRVLLIEKNAVLGKKLSITGGGRCNITNAEFDMRALLKHYGEAAPFLFSPFSQFGVKDTFDFFEKKNLPLVVEERKRAFPRTHIAPDVTKVMEQYVRDTGVTVLLDTAVRGFDVDNGEIKGIITDGGTYTGRSYVMAGGGRSHPETGSTGEGFSWLHRIGHTARSSNPNLVPLVVAEAWVRKASGTVMKDVKVTFQSGKHKSVKHGNVLITHFGLSGPLILNSAAEVQDMLKKGSVQAVIDLFPSDDMGALRSRFQALREAHGNKTVRNALREWFPNGIVEGIVHSMQKDVAALKMHELVREDVQLLLETIRSVTLTITGTKGLDWAVVSDGGVDLTEIDTRTMRSRAHPNLYIVGDMLHIQRPSGGYSLQLCWTTGYVAGSSAG